MHLLFPMYPKNGRVQSPAPKPLNVKATIPAELSVSQAVSTIAFKENAPIKNNSVN